MACSSTLPPWQPLNRATLQMAPGSNTEATVDRYVAVYRQGGLQAVRKLNWGNATSELLDHRDSLEESFRRNPPHTVAEACQRIKDETGIERGPTQVRAFLKKCLA